MSRDLPEAVPYTKYHRDGSVWAVGQTIGEVPHGYWEWFRLDGTRMRSGSFHAGEQTGEWTTYDRLGRVHKVTTMRLASAPKRT